MNWLRTIFATAALLLLGGCAVSNTVQAPAAPPPPPMVEVKTSMGAFVIELYPEKAPVTVENFLHYVNDGFYDGLIFHRVVKGFMIQGGAHFPDMTMRPPRGMIVNEGGNGLKNVTGAVAMARFSIPNSAMSQFYVNLADNPHLDFESPEKPGYAVFGKVVSGFEVVQAIGKVKTGYTGITPEVPKVPVLIESVKLVTPSAPAK